MIGRRDRKRNVVKGIAIGSGIAAAAGYIAGVLTAPKSGKETRAELKTRADKSLSEAEKDLKKAHTELTKIINDTKKTGGKTGKKAEQELGKILEKAKDTKEKARAVLSAVHEGDATDKDLSKAIKDANRAIEHLRDYIKK
jgi:gas vesicle protein